jgi:hypothetical protein
LPFYGEECQHKNKLSQPHPMSSRHFRVLDPNESYTFSKYFELPFAAEDILADLDCTLIRTRLTLPRSTETLAGLEFLSHYLERNLKYVTPVSEISRREILVAPVLLEVCDQIQQRLNIEYTVRVNDWLKGSLNYYIPALEGLLVVEAKQSDLAKGFVQLAAELIALDQWVDSPSSILRGAVTTGEVWKFGEFHRQSRQVVEDRTLYRVPDDLDTLFRILIAITT